MKYKMRALKARHPAFPGGVKVSTGAVKPGKRAGVGQVSVKNGPFKINAKRNNNFALAA